MKSMTNIETAEHIRKWVENNSPGVFGWPTDGCGYDQHIKFVRHRNKYIDSGGQFKTTDDFNKFCLDYADHLEGV